MAWTIFSALLPVFGLILIGYLCGRYDVLGDRAFEVLNRFVLGITLPILTFRSLAKMDPSGLAEPAMVGAITLGALATYAVGFAIERRLGKPLSEANTAALCSCFSNTGFVGLPIALLVFGEASLPPVAVAMLLYSTVVFGLGVVMTEVGARHQAGSDHESGAIRVALRSILRNPLIMLAGAGVGWSLLGLPLTGPVDTLLETLAQATAPCALTAIGIFIALPRQDAAPGPLGRVVALKLIGHPLITAGFLLILPPLPALWTKVAILMAAMPAGASSFVLAGKAGRSSMELSAWAVMLTTSLASASLIGVLWLIGV